MTQIEYEVDLRRMLCKNENVLRHKVSWEIQFHQPCCKRRDPFFTKLGCFYEAWMFLRSMDIFTKHESFSLWSMKRREGVFSPEAQKQYGMYIKFHASQRAELQIIYILDSKICTRNITVLLQQKLHWSSRNVFTMSTSPLSGPSPQLHLTTC